VVLPRLYFFGILNGTKLNTKAGEAREVGNLMLDFSLCGGLGVSRNPSLFLGAMDYGSSPLNSSRNAVPK
jgi:hypothetical protein